MLSIWKEQLIIEITRANEGRGKQKKKEKEEEEESNATQPKRGAFPPPDISNKRAVVVTGDQFDGGIDISR